MYVLQFVSLYVMFKQKKASAEKCNVIICSSTKLGFSFIVVLIEFQFKKDFDFDNGNSQKYI